MIHNFAKDMTDSITERLSCLWQHRVLFINSSCLIRFNPCWQAPAPMRLFPSICLPLISLSFASDTTAVCPKAKGTFALLSKIEPHIIVAIHMYSIYQFYFCGGCPENDQARVLGFGESRAETLQLQAQSWSWEATWKREIMTLVATCNYLV